MSSTATFADDDIRIRIRFPRFTPEALAANQPIVDLVNEVTATPRHYG